ncbi:MAG: hypothetical protein AAF191_06320 [Verrucomicrobiota bacterium]
MKLTEEQKAKVAGWAGEGLSLGQIQKHLEEEYAIQLTYMEARFLVADLEVSLKDPEREKPKEDLGAPSADEGEQDLAVDGGEEAFGEGAGGRVSVTLDTVAQPNAMVSGKVTFSDGETGRWSVDLTGRLALDPDTPGYRPTEMDLMEFQSELQAAARQGGF